MGNIKVRNFYYLIAGVLAILFAVTHAWNGHSMELPGLAVEAVSLDSQTVFTYVWHIITVENLVFGISPIILSFRDGHRGARFAAWMIVAILLVRLVVILGVTMLLNISALANTFIDSIAIILYVALIIVGTTMKKTKTKDHRMQERTIK